MSPFKKFIGQHKKTDAVPQKTDAAKASKTGFEPYKDERTDLIIRYEGDGCFVFENMHSFFPPDEEFGARTDPDGRSVEEMVRETIWLQCLLIKHGMMELDPKVGIGAAGEEFYYPFVCNGIPGIINVDRVWGVEGFAVRKDFADRCENVAETIRDIILGDGKNVNYSDWEEIKRRRELQKQGR